MRLTPVMWGLGWGAILLPNLYSYSIPGAYLKYFWHANRELLVLGCIVTV